VSVYGNAPSRARATGSLCAGGEKGVQPGRFPSLPSSPSPPLPSLLSLSLLSIVPPLSLDPEAGRLPGRAGPITGAHRHCLRARQRVWPGICSVSRWSSQPLAVSPAARFSSTVQHRTVRSVQFMPRRTSAPPTATTGQPGRMSRGERAEATQDRRQPPPERHPAQGTPRPVESAGTQAAIAGL
jgi:hypothetical protein